jgi:hypothetical protein
VRLPAGHDLGQAPAFVQVQDGEKNGGIPHSDAPMSACVEGS